MSAVYPFLRWEMRSLIALNLHTKDVVNKRTSQKPSGFMYKCKLEKQSFLKTSPWKDFF